GTAVAGGTLPSDVDTCDQGWTTCGNDLSSCQDDLAVAQACGNGIVDAGEDCDIGTLFEATCISEGFAGGTLACAGGCAFNTAGCYSSRFSDNADGTITDNETGLMWEKKIRLDSGVDVANLEDADNYYLWSGICSDESRCQPDAASEAACLAGAEGSTNGCARCATGTCNVTPNGTVWQWLVSLNTSGYGGHSDWRLPTKSELSALIDDGQPTSPRIAAAFHGASCGAACADVTDPACSCTRSDLYWSASSASPNTDTAWMVLFDIGDVDTVNKFFTSYVRAVRGGAQ
ncbi:MAG TPA: DUF1566 domain-containing protein, partial [Terriglobales bacterium]|nr:DUF1566 domain-containing protein [Terriglobales bacterium]